ncbi:hypothetical protein CSKR_110775 [Clonorchis sinensis]|uniref:Uncharacterized protein n=1 Tax=Clonorchis sinensis TaxID=79923 RepID=A0A3R7CI19_CLOSI|nr:hypothetical protein CSKR_110775 [Clonorchis sinensis]
MLVAFLFKLFYQLTRSKGDRKFTSLECNKTHSLHQTSVVRTQPLPLDFPCLDLGNLAVSQPSCLPRGA